MTPQRSLFWSAAFRLTYAILRMTDLLVRWSWAQGGLGITAELTIPGRHSRRPRTVLVGILGTGDGSYVGHPNGAAEWTRNLAAASRVVVRLPGGPATVHRATRLPIGAERSAAIAAAGRQQPWPGNWLYTAARRHIEAVGEYFRLDGGV